MTPPDEKTTLKRYLQEGRDAVLFKLEGLSEYDVRRPLTPTGTNLLGLVKHLALVEFGYFGATFDRPPADPPPSYDYENEPNVDMWAQPDESREDIVGLYKRAWAHADATIDALDLDATGHVAWWTPGNTVTLHQILVHEIAETHRHAGHADIVRETIDGAAGAQSPGDDMPDLAPDQWSAYREKVEQGARTFKN